MTGIYISLFIPPALPLLALPFPPLLSPFLQNGSSDAPVVLWLQGGPGGSSLFGLFVENGPLAVDSNGKGKEVWLLLLNFLWRASKFMRLPT